MPQPEDYIKILQYVEERYKEDARKYERKSILDSDEQNNIFIAGLDVGVIAVYDHKFGMVNRSPEYVARTIDRFTRAVTAPADYIDEQKISRLHQLSIAWFSKNKGELVPMTIHATIFYRGVEAGIGAIEDPGNNSGLLTGREQDYVGGSLKHIRERLTKVARELYDVNLPGALSSS